MKSAFVLFGTMLAAAALQATDARYSDELYRVKYGRSLPAKAPVPSLKKEARQTPACCLTLRRHDHLGKSAVASVWEDYFRAKYGTNSPAEEARLKAVSQELAVHRRMCVELGRCSQMVAQIRPADSAAYEHACCR